MRVKSGEQDALDDVIHDIARNSPQNLDEKNRELNRLLATCPKNSGDGIHKWLYRMAWSLWRYPFMLSGEFIIECLVEATQGCDRDVTLREIEDAVENSAPDQPKRPGRGLGPNAKCDEGALQKVWAQSKMSLAGIISASPEECGNWTAEDTLSLLYEDDPQVCYSYKKERPGGLVTSSPVWLFRPPPLMIPNPVLGEAAPTRAGRMSARALANVGARRYLVLDFDKGTKDEQAKIIWHLKEKWLTKCGLVMVLDSGKRSLHCWWDCTALAREGCGRTLPASSSLGRG